MNTIFKRVISLMLCFVLLAGYLSVGTLAEEITPVQEPSAITDVVVEEAAAEAEENDEESLTADTGDPLPVEETVSEDENATSEEEAPAAGEAVEEETPAEEEVTEEATEEVTEEVTEEATEEATEKVTEEVTEEATEETVAFELEVDAYVAPLLGADNVVDAAIFFSDLHTNKSDYKESTVKGIMNGLKGSSWNFSSVTSCGDAFSVNEDSGKYTGYTSTITGYIRSVFAGIPVNYVWSDHDRCAVQEDGKTLLDNDSGFIYGAGADGTYGTADDGNYYIYELSMADLSTNNRYNADFHSDAEVTATIAEFVADAANLDQTKPLFIASHQPLLDRRDDNGHALEWATAINTVAETMDVAFFFGHNHKYDVADDYYYAKGSTMSVCKDKDGNAENVKLNFTHLCTGYLAPASTNSTSNTTRQGTAMAAAISEDSIRYVTYDKDGVYTGSYALNETVTRDHAEAEDPGNSGETTETPDVTIVDASGNAVEAVVAVNNEASVQDAVADLLTNAVAYDIDIEDEVGDIVITLPIPQDVVNPAVYYVPVDGTPVDMNATKNDDGTVSFETNHNSTYAVGERAVTGDEGDTSTNRNPQTATGSGSTTTTTKKTVYVLSDRISADKEYLIVNGNRAGSFYALTNNRGSVAATGVTVKTDSKIGTYIELDDAADELWTVAGSNDGYTFACEDGYLYRASSSGGTTPRIDDSSTTWSYSTSNHRLSYTRSGSTYYLYYSSGWKVTTSSSYAGSIYFYIPTEIEEETTTTVSGTYSIAGNPAEVTKVVTNGATATLGSTLTFKPDSGSATTTDTSATAKYEIYSDPNGVISGISGNTVTFTGEIGEAVVKVSYKGDRMEKAVTNYITIIAVEPTYVLDITKDETVVTSTTLTKKGVTATTTLQLGTKVQYMDENGTSPVNLPQGATIGWNIPEEYQSIAAVDDNGLITFKGVDGAFYVTATLTVNGKTYTAGVNISATTSLYSVPSDHTSDFPEYPNEGAIRYDKTATAVGNFSQTGIAQVELSMTGVPYTTGSEMDVVLMLDRSSSMHKSGVQHRISSTVEATKAFIKNIVVNADGSFNNNRILVLDFLGGNLNTSAGGGSSHKFQSNRYTTNEDNGYQIINDQAELDALLNKIETDFKGQTSLYGTEYAQGLKACYDALNASRSDGNQQFCVFMSDGIPNYMQCETTHFDSTNGIVGMFDVTNRTAANGTATRNTTKYEYEYYSTQMKNEGVTVFTVGLGLYNTNSAWSNTSKEVCEQVANMLLNDIAGPAGETSADRDRGNTVSKLGSYFFSVADDNAAADMKNVFAGIAQKILQAATDVTVEDQITPEYTMIFDIPEGSKDITGVTNDFYIEFGKYALDEDHERDGYTSITKLYIENTNGTLSAKDSTAPVFEQKTIGDKGTLYYWSTNASDGDADVSVTVGGTTYYFVSYGMETAGYNMTSGAYASGTVDSTTNMSEDLVIATPYFVYNAAKRMIYWTVDKLDTEEYVLRYFLYLNNSATEVSTDKETDPGSYPTNEHAYITYTNFNGNDCRQEFPIPQLTWSGAQVSYVFYLVNAQGQPINKSGQVVDFANATFVTDVYTENTVWNKGEDGKITADSELDINWLAANLLPSDYKVYDEQALYQLHVYGNHDGTSNFDYFIIGGNDAATISESLNDRLEGVTTTASTVSLTTTKVYNTKAGEKITGYGTYTSEETNSIANEKVLTGFDFYNTTVAFAVVWQPALAPDTIVVDYGLDVLINVTFNDLMQDNTISGIGLSRNAYGNIAENTGISTTSMLSAASKTTADGSTISIEPNAVQIRFSQNDMTFDKPATFYYESAVKYYESSEQKEGYLHSSVTVIPATTIYYEDEFVKLTTYKDKTYKEVTYTETSDNSIVYYELKNGAYNFVLEPELGKNYYITSYNKVDGWPTDSSEATAIQAQDRPGTTQITGVIDANNNYGYDAAYSEMSTYSMGSAASITVNADTYGTASFEFYGTGFDIISLSDTNSGSLVVDVYPADETTAVKNLVVDTYFGYKKNDDGNWIITDENDPNALYQVPVMKVDGLKYGKYRAELRVAYDTLFDHNESSNETFWLDAVRIYDPAGSTSDEIDDTIEDAYAADGELFPKYYELRNWLIAAKDFSVLENTDTVNGIVFIDSKAENNVIDDYSNYGPNNELYLDAGQAVSFVLNASADAPANYQAASVQMAMKSVGNGAAKVKIYDADATTADKVAVQEIKTATDLYYDITSLNGKNVVIQNASDAAAILSVTNVKVTYEQKNDNNTENGLSVASEENVGSAEGEGVFTVTSESASRALLSLRPVADEAPDESIPESSEPEASEPETSEPETSEPETSEPEDTKPQQPQPDEEKPQSPIKDTIKKVIKVFKNIFGKWF